MKNFIVFFLFTFLSVSIFSQFDCSGVPTQEIDISGPPGSGITLEDREGDCCDGTNCIILEITAPPGPGLCIQFNGAPALGSLEIYLGDCSQEYEIGDYIPIDGSTTILFCKPGNNDYTITWGPCPCTSSAQPSLLC